MCGVGVEGGRAASAKEEAGRAGLGRRGGRTRSLPALLPRPLALGLAAGQAWELRAPSRRPHLSERRSEPGPWRASRRGECGRGWGFLSDAGERGAGRSRTKGRCARGRVTSPRPPSELEDPFRLGPTA